MAKCDKKRALRIIVDAAKEYEKKLNDKHFFGCISGNGENKDSNSGICVRADYFVGNTKAVLSVGFRTGRCVDFPVTLYSEDVRKLSQPTNRVLAIFSKMYHQQIYNECTYLSRDQQIDKLPVSEDVKQLIQV